MLHTAYISSILGFLQITASSKGIVSILFENQFLKGENTQVIISSLIPTQKETIENTHLKNAVVQLEEYFLGNRQVFNLDLDMEGTDFRQNVWQHLTKIPFGQTMSYAQFATQVGDLKAIRAIASANGKNRINIVVPCHRVVGQNGNLTGYAGELWRKEWLLKHEGSRLF